MAYISRHFDCTWDLAGESRDGRTLVRCREHGITLAMGRSGPIPKKRLDVSPTLAEIEAGLDVED